jgi:hypothetical protein
MNNQTHWQVFLDTEVFRRAQLNFDCTPFRCLQSLVNAGMVNVVTTSVVVEEVHSWVLTRSKEIVAAQKRFHKEAGLLRAADYAAAASALERIDATSLVDALRSSFAKGLKDLKATILEPTDVGVHEILDDYFASRPPFSSGEKKSEFPDAISMACLRRWAGQQASTVYVVSNDNDLAACCNPTNSLTHIPEVDALLTLIHSSEPARIEFVCRTALELAPRVGFQVRFDFANLDFSLFDQVGEVLDVNVTTVVHPTKFEVLSLDAAKAVLSTSVLVSYNAEIDYEDLATAFLDDDDETWRARRSFHRVVHRHAQVHVEVDVRWNGLDGTRFEIDNTRIVRPRSIGIVADAEDDDDDELQDERA